MTVATMKPGESFIDQLGNENVVTVGCKENRGAWLCADHPKADVHNNMMMHGHTQHGSHRMVWICAIHGPELP